MNMDGYLTTEQAADLLGVKVASVYLYVRRLEGFPQPTRIGRTLLFDEVALQEWRQQHPTRKPRGGSDSPAP